MKWSWNINQRAVIDNNLDIDVIDLSIFEMLKDFTHSSRCKKLDVNGKMYYLMGWKLVVDQLPILKLRTRRSVTKRYEKLKNAGIIEAHPGNKALRGMWFSWGVNYDLLITSTRNESTSLGINVPSTRYESSHVTRYESSHNTIINNTSIKNKREDAPAKTTSLNSSSEIQKEKIAAKRKRFQPPTLEEVEAHMLHIVDSTTATKQASLFYNYYESNGWKVGRNKMKKWKSSASGWIERMNNYTSTKSNNEKTNDTYGAARVDTLKAALAELNAGDY